MFALQNRGANDGIKESMIIKIKHCCPILTVFLLLLLASLTNAENIEPAFQQFRVEKQFNSKPAPVDLNSAPGASRFRTVLRDGVKKGPNFAGHYAIVEWGCGSSCTSIAVIDVSDGRIMFPDEISPLFFPGLSEGNQLMDKYELSYYKDSSLLIVNGIPSKTDKVGSYYYQWKADKFELIYSRKWETKFNK